jgi:FkbM family methyltransferase
MYTVEQDKLDLYKSVVKAATNVFKISRVVCNTPHGNFMVDLNDKDVGSTMLLVNEVNYGSMQKWFDFLNLPANTGIFLDVGANVGTTCIPLALDGKFKKIFAFEPDPANFEILEYNIKTNHVGNIVEAHNVAVGSVNQAMEFEISPDNFGDHRIKFTEKELNVFGENTRKHITVNCITLDRFIKDNHIEFGQISLIKVDTQGAEGHAFKGADDILKHKIPWVIEFWPYGLHNAGTEKEEFIRLVSGRFSKFVEIMRNDAAFVREMAEIEPLFNKYTVQNVAFCDILWLP